MKLTREIVNDLRRNMDERNVESTILRAVFDRRNETTLSFDKNDYAFLKDETMCMEETIETLRERGFEVSRMLEIENGVEMYLDAIRVKWGDDEN